MDSGLDLWRAVAQTDELVDFFTGMFDVIGITIEETGEEPGTWRPGGSIVQRTLWEHVLSPFVRVQPVR